MNSSILVEAHRLVRTNLRTRPAALVLIIILGSYLRFYDLRNTPGWYTDEGSDIDIASHLLDGEIRYMSIAESTMLVARPLAFNYLVCLVFRIIGQVDVLTLRTLTATATLLSIVLLGTWGQRAFGSRTGLLAAGLLSVFPMSVVYSRIGFSYNVAQPLMLVATFSVWEYLQSGHVRWLSGAGVALMLCISVSLVGFVFLLYLSIFVLCRNPRHLAWLVLLTIVGIVLCSLPAVVRAPEAFLYDLKFTFGRTSPDALVQLMYLMFGFPALLDQGMWFSASFVGLLLIVPPAWRRYWGYLPIFYIVVVGRGVLMVGGSLYLVIPLLPHLSIGLAFGLERATTSLHNLVETEVSYLKTLPRLGRLLSGVWDRDQPATRWVRAIAAIVPLALALHVLLGATVVITLGQLRLGMLDLPDGFTVSVGDADEIIARVNAVVRPDDIVLASPQIGWALEGRVADFQQSVAFSGQETVHFPGGLPKSRFAFNPALSNADFVVIDDLWRGWASEAMPAVREMVAEVDQWPVVTTVGEFSVHRNPAKRCCSNALGETR